jgi:hypothetical protein
MPFWVLDYKIDSKSQLVPKAVYCGTKLDADKYKEEEAHPQSSIHELPTTDLNRATQMLKAKRIDLLSDVKEGMQRFRRK